jgi:glucose-6-phosphate 1-dehydrogenase
MIISEKGKRDSSPQKVNRRNELSKETHKVFMLQIPAESFEFVLMLLMNSDYFRSFERLVSEKQRCQSGWGPNVSRT